MMALLKKNIGVVLAILVAVFALVIYLNYFSGSSSVELLTSTGDETGSASTDLLATLSNLHSIKLNNSIFSDPVFLSLTSFGVELPLESVGRRNPFAPVGSQ